MSEFICNIKNHYPVDYSIGNAGVVNGVRTLTARCCHCKKDIESSSILGTQQATPWRLRTVSPAS